MKKKKDKTKKNHKKIQKRKKKITTKKQNKKKVALRWSWNREARWLPAPQGALGALPARPETPHGPAAELPRGLSSAPHSLGPRSAAPCCGEPPQLALLLQGKVLRAVKPKTCARAVAEAAPLCIYRCSILPATVTAFGASGGEQGHPAGTLGTPCPVCSLMNGAAPVAGALLVGLAAGTSCLGFIARLVSAGGCAEPSEGCDNALLLPLARLRRGGAHRAAAPCPGLLRVAPGGLRPANPS